jgi:hypothetical protein
MNLPSRAKPGGSRGGTWPPRPSNFSLTLCRFFFSKLLLPTLNHSPRASTLDEQSISKTRRTEIHLSSFYHFRILSL